MRRTTAMLLLALIVGVLAVALAGCGGDDDGTATDTDTATETDTGGGEAGGTLIGNVGPGFEISLTTEGGEAVTSIPAGSYSIEINDQAPDHNFHLTGAGGVDTSTTVEEVTEITWELELEAGMYDYVCDPHASSMNGSFEVTG